MQPSPGAFAGQAGCQGTLLGTYLPRLRGGVPDAVKSILGLSPWGCGFEQPKKVNRQIIFRPVSGTLQAHSPEWLLSCRYPAAQVPRAVGAMRAMPSGMLVGD